VVDQYPSTPAAPLAMLSVAAQHYDAGQYELAQHMFAEFLQRHPNHDLKAIAELGQAQCLEATGRFNEAVDAFSKFLAAHPDHYLTPVAMFAKARCLEQGGQLQDAKAIYEDYLAANPTNDWSARAQSSLLFVEKQIRLAQSGQAQQPPAMSLEPIQIQPMLQQN
jgi:outer membrane protein assembly factor BamD (BamD/ComL family)